MKFKHTINVLIDNFRTTYKLLLYQLVILLISIGLCAAIIVPFFRSLSDTEAYINLAESIRSMTRDILEGEIVNLSVHFKNITHNFSELVSYLSANPSSLILCIIGLIIVMLIRRFLIGLGNYTAGTVINDKMAMQTNSPFISSLIKNLGKACSYNALYVPLSFIYDAVCVVIIYLLMFKVLLIMFPLLIVLMLSVVAFILLMGVKMMLTTDWLPAIICGKNKNKNAIRYSFSRKGGDSVGVYSFFATSCVIILAINVLAAIGTFGAALIVTIPLSYLYILCFEFVNYNDNNEIKYFTDKRTIVKPEQEKETSREQFLRGE